jgi:hypothetical protein
MIGNLVKNFSGEIDDERCGALAIGRDKSGGVIVKSRASDGSFFGVRITESDSANWRRCICSSAIFGKIARECDPDDRVLLLTAAGRRDLLTIRAGGARFRVPQLLIKEVDQPSRGKQLGHFHVPTDWFRLMTNLTSFSTQDSFANPSLSGIGLKLKDDELWMSGFDGRRLSYGGYKGLPIYQGSVFVSVIPQKLKAAVSLISDLGYKETRVECYERGLRVRINKAHVWIPLPESDPFDAEELMRTMNSAGETCMIQIGRTEFQNALRKVSLVVGDMDPVRLVIHGATCVVSSTIKSTYDASSTIAADIVGANHSSNPTAYVFADTFREVLKSVKSEKMRLMIPVKDAKKVQIDFPEFDNFTFLAGTMAYEE